MRESVYIPIGYDMTVQRWPIGQILGYGLKTHRDQASLIGRENLWEKHDACDSTVNNGAKE